MSGPSGSAALRSLAGAVVARARLVLVLAVVGIAVVGVAASGVDDRLSTGGNEVPGSESVRAAQALEGIDDGPPNLVVLISQPGGVGPAAAQAAADVAALLAARPDVTVVGSAWDDDGSLRPRAGVVADDGTSGLVVGHLAGGDAEIQRRGGEVAAQLRSLPPPAGVTIEAGGVGPARADLVETTDRDLVKAELIALPLTLLILLLAFRTPAAAALPLLVAAVGVVGTLGLLRLLVEWVEVSIFARSVATAIGLAMAIDMSLFLIGRYRELRPALPDPQTAVVEAVAAAGPAMVFSALTTAASLAGLLAFDTPLLRSFAYAGVSVTLAALVGGLVVLPAALTVLGDRLEAWPVRPARPHRPGTGVWHRVASTVMARPVAVGLTTTVVLLAVASPLLRITFGLNDDRVLPPSVESRRVLDTIRDDYAALESGSVPIVFADGRPGGEPGEAVVARLVAELGAVGGVGRVDDHGRWLSVVPTVEPVSPEGRQLVERLRAVPSPVPLLVGGEAGRLVDNIDHVTQRLPVVVAAMVVVSGLLLALLFRSVLLPLKAIVLNLLSLSAMFGAIVWVFQDGRLSGVLGYTPTGMTDITVPTLMFCIAFGLAMDYEVFLLSRIRDELRWNGPVPTRQATVAATATGLQRTGGILSASAVTMAVVFSAFATGSVAHLKVLGVGVSLAVLVDAFVIRALLVPSVMALAGSANWWPGRSTTTAVTPPSAVPPGELDGSLHRPGPGGSRTGA